MTVQAVAADMNVSTKTIYRRIKSGKLKVLRLSPTAFRIDEKDYADFKKSCQLRKEA